MLRRWKVVGGRSSGGIVVREGPDLGAKSISERLATGAVIEEETALAVGTCDRLRYRKLLGQGPETGWISFEANGNRLITPVKHVSFKETSWLETTRYQEIAQVRAVVEANCCEVGDAVSATFQGDPGLIGADACPGVGNLFWRDQSAKQTGLPLPIPVSEQWRAVVCSSTEFSEQSVWDGGVENSSGSFSLGLRPLFPSECIERLHISSDGRNSQLKVSVLSDASRKQGPLRAREVVQSTLTVSEESSVKPSRRYHLRIDCDRITEATDKGLGQEMSRELERYFEPGCVLCTCEVRPRADGRTELVRRLLGGSILMEAAPGLKPAGKPDFSEAIPLLSSQILFMLDVETRVWLSIRGFPLVDIWRGIRRPFQWAVFSGMNAAASQIFTVGSAADTIAEQKLGLDLPVQAVDELRNILPECKNSVGEKHGQFTEGSVDILSFIGLLNRVCRRADACSDIFREFTDLGSGRGHAILAAHAFFPFRKCRGYEIDQEALSAAETSARQYVRSGLVMQARSTALPHKMFLRADFVKEPNWTDSSVVFVNGVTWPSNLIAETARLALRLKPGSVIMVVARRFPVEMEFLQAFDVRGEACLLSFSQTRPCQVFVYQRR